MAAKVLDATDFHVVVHPTEKRWGTRSAKASREACEELLAQIRRHVDFERAEIQWTVPVVCEFCGAQWTERSRDCNGGCCDEDEKRNPSQMSDQAQA